MSTEPDRHYDTTNIPTLRNISERPECSSQDREFLLKLYEQTCVTWRMLVDVRFKLFALVPTASLISLAIFIGATDPQKQLHPRLLLAFALLGLAATIGLLIYDLRNSELHNDLISRLRRIEYEVGVHTGAFLGRVKPKGGLIKHDTATKLIYGSAILSWIAAIIWAVLRVMS